MYKLCTQRVYRNGLSLFYQYVLGGAGHKYISRDKYGYSFYSSKSRRARSWVAVWYYIFSNTLKKKEIVTKIQKIIFVEKPLDNLNYQVYNTST